MVKYQGENIKLLIPQREPFIMVDEIEAADDTHAVSAFYVRTGNYFLLPDGTMAETGVMEHVAQSCSALKGLITICHPEERSAGGKAPIGLIGEVKHFECQRRPRHGETITTTIAFTLVFGQVTLAEGTCRVGDEQIAKIKLKIFMMP